MSTPIEKARRLVGDISEDQLRYVDYFVSRYVGLFMPSVGPCFYATTPLHVHPSYSFVLTTDDSCRMEIDGVRMASQQGKLCALSPGVSHHEIIDDDFVRYIAVFIDKSFFESQLKACSIPGEIAFRGEIFDSTPDLIAEIKAFMVEYENAMPGCEQVLDAIGLRITHLIIRQCFAFKPAPSTTAARIQVGNVIDYLHANYARKVTVGEMAGVMALSPSHFSRLFKRETGKTPLEYLIQIRLKQASKLLRAGDKSLTRVAMECGFSSLSHFSTCFFQRYNATPSEYRKALQ